MDDREFFDILLQTWAQTFGAENMYWKVEPVETGPFDQYWEVYAVDAKQEEYLIGTFLGEADADFTAGVHGCLPDLVRRLHAAVDEADRLDLELDVTVGRLAAAELRVMELEQEVADLKDDLEGVIAG